MLVQELSSLGRGLRSPSVLVKVYYPTLEFLVNVNGLRFHNACIFGVKLQVSSDTTIRDTYQDYLYSVHRVYW